MRVVDFDDQRLTVYVPEGLFDRLALLRIPGVERGHMPLLPFEVLYFRRWDGPGKCSKGQHEPARKLDQFAEGPENVIVLDDQSVIRRCRKCGVWFG